MQRFIELVFVDGLPYAADGFYAPPLMSYVANCVSFIGRIDYVGGSFSDAEIAFCSTDGNL